MLSQIGRSEEPPTLLRERQTDTYLHKFAQSYGKPSKD